MVVINPVKRELTAKIVYYGPGLCGKTTNLKYVYEVLDEALRGKMLSLATEADRTLFFDFLPVDMGEVKGFRVRMQLYTVPGQVFYEATRKRVLMGADGVVFVADSQRSMWDANIQAFEQLTQHLNENGIKPDDIPIVLQYNKRDLPDISTVEELDEALNPGNLAFFEAMASEGVGVEETLRSVTKQVLKNLLSRNTGKEKKAAKEVVAPLSPPPPPAPKGAANATVMMNRDKLLAELGIAGTPSAKKAAKPPGPSTPPPAPSGEGDLFESQGENALLGGGDSLNLLGESSSVPLAPEPPPPAAPILVEAPDVPEPAPLPEDGGDALLSASPLEFPLSDLENLPVPSAETAPGGAAEPLQGFSLAVGQEVVVPVTVEGKSFLLRLRLDAVES